ncbi:FAD-binding oxidoreductase [Aquincola sp. S2]|uniref:FAD-binding oxidoreductase n=1 Tax=Pseudaquabacterium terrae TaxID=2732868 RepID=A0ABX2EES7_9BURK|nr:FAD-binding oxidoreductase [Aquabacterium terrae]NRF67125.1 FAD-binding oxidoreductase [Aquabacterium terrae]
MNDTPAEPFDCAIVGAGIAGASLAYQLAPHARVLLLERESQPGYHTTGRSAAMFMESYGPPQARALTRASRGFYTAPPAGFTELPLLQPRGALYIGWSGDEARLDEVEAELRATGSVIQRIDAAAARALCPVLRPLGLLGGLWEADAMDIDVHALHHGFLRGARHPLSGPGATLRCGAGLARAESNAAGWTLTLDDGSQVTTHTLVNAAGAWADAVATIAGARPRGLQPNRRSAFSFAAPADIDVRHWPAVDRVDDSWYFKPDAGRLLGSPANVDPVPPHDVQPEELDIALGIHRIQQCTTLEIRRPQRTWAGLRTFAPDGELVIGWDGAVNGFFWLCGQGGYGIQTAWAAGALAAALWRGVALPPELQAAGVEPARLAPTRFGPSA